MTVNHAVSTDPIAIVGVSCRLPGHVTSPEGFWEVLRDGRDVVSEIPDNRWSKDTYYSPLREDLGRTYTVAAGVLDRIDRFDAAFFGISPREAEQIDPHQRILLELAVEALNDAGEPISRVGGSNCGVFVGISATDYANLRYGDPSSGDAYFMTGNTLSIASNRVSYFLDIHGPSFSIDTACSSSLLALHQACQAIRGGEADTALVGGVNLLLSPFPFIGFSRASMLSPIGQCRAFDADGQGYVRAEGGVVVMLKRLSAARRDGNPVHAVIRGTGVNADGRTPGLSMPGQSAQRELLEHVYREAGLRGSDLSYLEAHGTGTAVGDPVEAGAIGQALGVDRDLSDPLLIGSVKTNVGHLEPASGLVGVLKALLSFRHGVLPPSLHFDTPNPNIDFKALGIRVLDELSPLPEPNGRAIIGVNSFGFGGANAHVILERPDTETQRRRSRPKTKLLLLSGHTPDALRAVVDQYIDWLPTVPPEAVGDVIYTHGWCRDRLKDQVAVWGSSVGEIVDRLKAFREGAASVPGLVSGHRLSPPGSLAFVFSGNGAQFVGMGQTLLRDHPPFAKSLARLDTKFQRQAGWSLVEVLGDDTGADLDRTEIAQPLLFAIQIVCAELLAAEGVRPAAVVGHSVGEVAAAYVAGALKLDDAIRVIIERSCAQGRTRGAGKMAAVSLSADEAQTLIDTNGLALEVAGINSPRGVTISGSLSAIEAMRDLCESQGVPFFKVLDLDYAFHSQAMDPVREDLIAQLDGMKPRQGRLKFSSTVIGSLIDGRTLGATYWWDNIRQPVRFSAAVDALIDDGTNVFLEIGPSAILQSYLREALRAKGVDGRVLSALTKRDQDFARLRSAALEVLISGVPYDLEKAVPTTGRAITLPVYPWQGERFWFKETSESSYTATRTRHNPLLGFAVQGGVDGVYENFISLALQPWLSDHRVDGAAVLPAAAYCEIALAFGVQQGIEPATLSVEGLEIRRPVTFDDVVTKQFQTTSVGSNGSFEIRSRDRLSEQPWTVNAVGRVVARAHEEVRFRLDEPSGGWRDVSLDDHFTTSDALGLDYGPAFRPHESIAVHTGDGFARIAYKDLKDHPGVDGMMLPPTVVDAGFQVLFDILMDRAAEAADADVSAYLPVRVGRIDYIGADPVVHCRMRIERSSPRSVTASFVFESTDGRVQAYLHDCRFQKTDIVGTSRAPDRYAFRWTARTHPAVLGDIAFDVGAIAEAVRQTVAESALDREERHYDQAIPLLDALASAFARDAIMVLARGNDSFTLDRLQAAGEVADERIALLIRLLGILVEDGVLIRDGERFAWAADVELPSGNDIWRAIVADLPDYLPEAVLLGRAGRALVPTLRGGAIDQSGAGAIDHFQAASRTRSVANDALVATIGEVASRWPDDRVLRVLDLAGDNVSMTVRVLKALPADRTAYFAIHSDDGMLTKIEGAVEPFHFARAIKADLAEADCLDLLEKAGPFDLVIAGDVMHRFDDPQSALARIRALLVTHGLLVMAEARPDRLMDVVFGADMGWWRGMTESGQPVSRLMPPRHWQIALGAAGFTAPPVVIGDVSIPSKADIFLILADNPIVLQSDDTVAREQGDDRSTHHVHLLVADSDGFSLALSEYVETRLRDDGRVIVVEAGEALDRVGPDRFRLPLADRAQWADLWRILQSDDGIVPTTVTFLAGLLDHGGKPGFDPDRVYGAARHRSAMALALAQSLGVETAPAPHLYVLTRGTLNGDGWADGTLRGFARVLMNENPRTPVQLIDVPSFLGPDDVAALIVDDITMPDGEDEVAYTAEGLRLVPRLEVLRSTPVVSAEQQVPSTFKLEIRQPGALNRLHWCETQQRSLQPTEVVVKPRMTGLNFRDVMLAMGLLGDEAVEDGFAGPTLGMECAGDVVAVGDAVDGFAIGDRVLCFAPQCFASHVTTETTAMGRIPDGMSYAEAATVPSAFFTAYYVLDHLARLRPGERVLIHGAAGGVGLASIQYARHRGAEIFATAGTEEKRDYLRLLGVDHVLDSRTLGFAEDIMEITGGTGVDVVVNSLAGEAIDRNLAILRPFGRFIELGKRDFYANSQLGLRPFRNNISYFGVDADQLLRHSSTLARSLFQEIMGLFADGIFRPLSHRVFAADDVVDAFRHMQQSRQIGKVVIDMTHGPKAIQMQRRKAPTLSLSRDGTYLVTGGLGGFGLATARWLARKGAGRLVLLGRRGTVDATGAAAIADIQAGGTEVDVVACDVSDAAALQRVVDSMPIAQPLRGVVHAAMVLDDGVIANLSAERIEAVLRPKVLGAGNLDALTRDAPLDFFVMYSSATTFLGNLGQANYVAANAALEDLATARRAAHRPALAVSWGPIADVGYLTKNSKAKDSLSQRFGRRDVTAAAALDVLEQLLCTDGPATVAVANLEWRLLKRALPAAQSRKYSDLVALVRESGGDVEGLGDIRQLVAGKNLIETQDIVAGLVADQVGGILRLPGDKIDRTKPLLDLGMDSLMAVELRVAIDERLGIDLPVMALSDGVSIRSIAEKLALRLRDESGATADDESVNSLLMRHRGDESTDQFEELVDDIKRSDLTQNRLIQ